MVHITCLVNELVHKELDVLNAHSYGIELTRLVVAHPALVHHRHPRSRLAGLDPPSACLPCDERVLGHFARLLIE